MSLVSEALKQLQTKQSGPALRSDNSGGGNSPVFYPTSNGPSKKVIIALALGAVIITALFMSLGIFLALSLYFPGEQPANSETNSDISAIPENDIAPLFTSPDQKSSDNVKVESDNKASSSNQESAGIHERYQVTMIIKSGSSAMAKVNGRTVEIGDRLSENSRVVDIQSRHIIIEENGKRYRLTSESSR